MVAKVPQFLRFRSPLPYHYHTIFNCFSSTLNLKLAIAISISISYTSNHEREREMAYVALTSLMATLELEFLQPIPRPSLHYHHHQPLIISFFQNLSSLRQFLDIFRSRSAPRDLEIKIRDFALEAEDNIETQISNFLLLSKHNSTAHQQESSQQLCRTLLEAAQNAADLLNITNTQKDGETQRMRACDALTSLIWKIRYDYAASGKIRVNHIPPTLIESLMENLSSLRQFLEIANFHGAASIKIKDLATRITDFAFNAKQDITNQSNDLRHSRLTDKHEKLSNKLLQTLEEVAENTSELLNSINNTTNEADEASECETQPPIPWLKHNASQSVNVNVKGGDNGSSSLRCSEDTIMVGRQNDVTTIKDRLFSSFGGLDVIPIIGMPGIGKTTLARTIFEDQLVTQHFEVKIWFTMPQKYNEIQIQRDLLQSITQVVVQQHECKDGRTVSEMVQECLIQTRYLIVIDDIWSTQHWRYISDCFPSYVEGSRILLTTRLYEVAHYACPFKGNHHVMSLLDPNESWDLFCNNFPLEKYSAPRFESFRSHLSNAVEKCDGLPQAIVIVAERLLECKDNIQHELKKIEKEIELLGILDYSALTFIYNQLPEYLKVCFLYLGIFPKRSEIQVKTLLRLWIAEGFVKPSKNEELEKIAYCYLKDLIDRSLVLISNWTIDGKIKTCRVHSVIHNICFREAQKEGILCAVNTQQLPRWALNGFANSCRWFSLCKHSFDYYVLFSSNNPRSIFFFQENSDFFVPFKLLRVMAFIPSPFLQRVPMHLGDLVFLRYLSVTQWFEGLNDVVSTNLNLQTLVVFGNDSESQLGVPTLHLPSTIWESPQLKHLELGSLYKVDPPSVVKWNLQTLYWAGPTHCRKKLYSSFPNINKLKIFCKEDMEPIHIGGSSRKDIILDNLDYLARLESLTISVSVGSVVTFPKRCMFPSQLKKLRLKGTNLSRRDLNVIGTLKCLEVLKLENAFHEEVWRVAEGGFFGLKFLLLKDIKLKRLEAYRYSFPYLERLVLRCLHYLEEIPSSFGEIFYLKSIELDRCSRSSIVASAKDIQEKLEKNFGKANFKIKIQEPEYDESGNIVERDEDVGVGKFEKANFEIKIQEPEYNGVGKFKSYIHKLKNKRWRNMLRHKPKSSLVGQADLRRET
ncbi:putative late blight resistance protein homolog R1A-10 [Ipomoea triloba]|uniref:putative late blight resistance protein homolog R1A-10 n=1 Tax=Ipomoea triloba TaxID=35885 RepID=UPI00125CD9B6|nr:putative late blight resistance protein homolog R1A-10 [Ipomoea triloba]XP_031098338.1 putative late blight resistance protein homolog R1A-10 [Ipomoea triloba]XP_031098339.1 putative late blight resistance protein homolog R1A-10 [Ipomoea triloba]XP_031098340.1 putative late blight resistance protein homolog R1A-10 [Ipomoea triloba]XP_031098341.1 putative late blight resistance protein homolog R1A-10 [Ipomoea triloba]